MPQPITQSNWSPTFRRRRWAAVPLAALALVAAPMTGTAAADEDRRRADAEHALKATELHEAELYTALNAERARAGLPGLVYDPALVVVAREQAGRMAALADLEHSRDLGSRVAGWRRVAENVGYGGSPGHVHDLLVGSRAHRANILDRASDRVGLGTATDPAGRLWVAEVFVDNG